MNTIEEALDSITGYMLKLSRNTTKGWYELEIGIPAGWVFTENKEVGCEILSENEIGKVIRIYPKDDNVIADDLVDFVEMVILTNEKIAEREREFKDEMDKMKGVMEEQVKKFYKELDELRVNSFAELADNDIPKVSKKRGRKPKESATDVVSVTPEVPFREGYQPTDKLDTAKPPKAE